MSEFFKVFHLCSTGIIRRSEFFFFQAVVTFFLFELVGTIISIFIFFLGFCQLFFACLGREEWEGEIGKERGAFQQREISFT